MTTIVAALFLSLGVFSADAIKHQHSKTKSAGEASPTAVEMEETTTTKEHLLDPALNTDEVRDAAKQVGHITDMDAYLAAIEHKMDVLAEHPAHNVRFTSSSERYKIGTAGGFRVLPGPPCWRFFSPPLSGVVFFQNDLRVSLSVRAHGIIFLRFLSIVCRLRRSFDDLSRVY
jgi:hypothetical protein